MQQKRRFDVDLTVDEVRQNRTPPVKNLGCARFLHAQVIGKTLQIHSHIRFTVVFRGRSNSNRIVARQRQVDNTIECIKYVTKAMMHVRMLCIWTLYTPWSKNLFTFIFLMNNAVKNWPILITFGINHIFYLSCSHAAG